MSMTRRNLLAGAAVASAMLPGLRAASDVRHYVRFRKENGRPTFGELDGETIHPIDGSVLGDRKRTGDKIAVADVKLLFPIRPPKVFAVGLNYKSHLGSTPAPKNPEIFYKPQRRCRTRETRSSFPRTPRTYTTRLSSSLLSARTRDASRRARLPITFWGTRAATTCPNGIGRTEISSGGAPRAPTPSRRWDRPSRSALTTCNRRSVCA